VGLEPTHGRSVQRRILAYSPIIMECSALHSSGSCFQALVEAHILSNFDKRDRLKRESLYAGGWGDSFDRLIVQC
jgi:hypothetical protein